MSMKINKAKEISDCKIDFVSLVDKAANNRPFLIAKARKSDEEYERKRRRKMNKTVSTVGRIIKVDDETHYVTGVVYEPMVEDAHGNFMSADEIKKAAYYFAKNSDQVDIQHSFEAADGLSVVENYITPSDMEIGGEKIAKGTWILTVEINNKEVWDKVKKGEITGLSMGGEGKFAKEDVDLKKGGVFKHLSKLFDKPAPVKKGELLDSFGDGARIALFDQAGYELRNMLFTYDDEAYEYIFNSDEAAVKAALTEYIQLISGILLNPSNQIVPTVVDVEEVAVEASDEPVEKGLTVEDVEAIVQKALQPFLKARGVPKNLTDGEKVTKSQHYLAGLI